MLSVVAPFYNEWGVLPYFCAALREVLEGMGTEYEVILVDDGSTDDTVSELLETVRWQECRVVRLVRNAGHQNALDAGLREARGEWVVTMDSDLQHPPQFIPHLMALAGTEGAQIVSAARRDRAGDGVLKRTTGSAYYSIMRVMTGIDVVTNAADFRLLSRKVVDALNAIGQEKVFRLLIPSLGFPTAVYEYSAAPRHSGKTKYSLRKMLLLATQSSLSFSSLPLRWVFLAGLACSLGAFVWLLAVLVSFLLGYTISGWASLMVAVLLLGGLQLLALGLIGEYVATLFSIAQGRPPYLVDDVVHLADAGRQEAAGTRPDETHTPAPDPDTKQGS